MDAWRQCNNNLSTQSGGGRRFFTFSQHLPSSFQSSKQRSLAVTTDSNEDGKTGILFVRYIFKRRPLSRNRPPPPPTRPTHMKPSVKWWTLNLTQQAVSAKRGLRSPDKVGMRRRQGVRTLLSTKTTKLEARPSYTLPLILV